MFDYNEYIKKLDVKFTPILTHNFNLLSKGKLTKTFGNRIVTSIIGDPFHGAYTNWREKYVQNFGFVLYSKDWIKPLSKWIGDRPCLEIMAGSGMLSYFLSLYGVKIRATDNFSWKNTSWFIKNEFSVENLDCIEAIRKYGRDVKFVICSWPYMDNNAFLCLQEMRKVNPKCRMIYIGEGMGGCTANDNFFETAEYIDLNTFDKAVSKYSIWEGIHDNIFLFK